MLGNKSRVRRRDVLGALAGAAVLNTFPTRAFSQATAPAEIVFASAPFFSRDFDPQAA